MNLGQARARLVQGCAALAAGTLIAGCGSAYRPVVTPVTPSGPAAQTSSYAVVVSAPSPTTPGIATVIDYSGDSVLALAPIGIGPVTFTIDQAGSNGYTINSDGTLSNFPISSNLQAKQVEYSTLPSTADPVNLFSPSFGLYAADLNSSLVDVFNGFPESFKLSIPVAPAPIMIVGPSIAGQRDFAISQNLAAPTGVECNNTPGAEPGGSVNGIEISTLTLSSDIPVGKCPVFAVETPDNRRLVVMNRGDDTISVINSQNNTADTCTPFQNQNGQWVTCHPVLPLSQAALNLPGVVPPPNCDVATNPTCGLPAIAGPVYAEYNQATNQLVVADYDGGTISVIDMSEDEYGNDYNTYANPTCTANGVNSYANCGAITGGFGTTYTIAVGNNPAAVTVLADGSRAYAANQADQTVTIVTLSSHTVEKTLPVTGHPRTVVSTQNSQYGKVYVASPDSPYLTILRTDLDIVDTVVLVEGNLVDVRVTTTAGSGGNTSSVSRRPGFGQPCFLPGAAYSATLAGCRTLP
ncbi:MAG: YncE family protein [Terracidiphilus sp.]